MTSEENDDCGWYVCFFVTASFYESTAWESKQGIMYDSKAIDWCNITKKTGIENEGLCKLLSLLCGLNWDVYDVFVKIRDRPGT